MPTYAKNNYPDLDNYDKNDFEIVDKILVDYKGQQQEVLIPQGVVDIKKYAFLNCESITGVVIPEGVIKIGESAFAGCKNLENVVLPESLITIDEEAFRGCTSLKEISIPDNVTTLGWGAFSNPNLKKIHIGKSVSSIEKGTIDFYANIKITVDESNQNYVVAGGILYNKSKTKIIFVPRNIQGDVAIAEGVTIIEKHAFFRCENLISITIPGSVTEISKEAFSECEKLKNVTFEPNSKLTTIGNYAFEKCNALEKIELPSSIRSLGESVFADCINLKSIILPQYINSIGIWICHNCFPNLVIYCRAKHKGHSWNKYWNVIIPETTRNFKMKFFGTKRAKTIWGYKK